MEYVGAAISVLLVAGIVHAVWVAFVGGWER